MKPFFKTVIYSMSIKQVQLLKYWQINQLEMAGMKKYVTFAKIGHKL